MLFFTQARDASPEFLSEYDFAQGLAKVDEGPFGVLRVVEGFLNRDVFCMGMFCVIYVRYHDSMSCVYEFYDVYIQRDFIIHGEAECIVYERNRCRWKTMTPLMSSVSALYQSLYQRRSINQSHGMVTGLCRLFQ